jgi:hypothetical protein
VSLAGLFLLADPEVCVLDGAPPGFRGTLKQLTWPKKETRELPTGAVINAKPVTRSLVYMTAPPHKLMLIVRLEFNARAKDDQDSNVRFAPGSVRLVAPKKTDSGTTEPGDYYPVGTLEKGLDRPALYLSKPDDFIFVISSGAAETKPGVDLVYVLDDDLVKDHKVASGLFLEFKRLVRFDLGGKEVTAWKAPEIKKEGEFFGTRHQVDVELIPAKPPGT